MKKDTSKMLQELQDCSDFKRFYQCNEDFLVTQSLSELLSELLKKHNIKKAEAIRGSELSDDYAYQIFSGLRVPERKKLLCLTIGMGLNLEEIQTLLKTAGYAQLYVKNTFDCILVYGICKKMTVSQINYVLFDYGMETLG